jgi:hypothetical protein
MAEMMHPDCVQSGVADYDFEIGTGGRVGLKDCGDVLADGF